MKEAMGEAAAGKPAASPENDQALEDRRILGPLTLRVEQDAVLAFQRATGGLTHGDHVPLTFPVSFLSLPDVRATIAAMIGKGIVPVHEAQSFAYAKGLSIGAEYCLEVTLSRTQKPPRLTLDAAISTLEGESCARIETILRLVPLTS